MHVASYHCPDHPYIDDIMYGVNFVTKNYPGMWKIIEPLVARRFQERAAFVSKECFLPASTYHKIIEKYTDEGIWYSGDTYSIAKAAFFISSICPFKYTRHIYEFKKALSDELLNTDFNGKIPFEIFDRFPNYSICLKFHKCIMYCAIIDFESKEERVLVFSYFTEDDKKLDGIDFHRMSTLLLPITTEQTINELFENQAKDYTDWRMLKKYINLILYICSEEPDIREQDRKFKPREFQTTLTKMNGKFKLLPALRNKIFIVGEKLDKSLLENKIGSTGTKVRPHIRRAHWHGYWKGKQRTEFILKWLPPILVATNNGYEESICA